MSARCVDQTCLLDQLEQVVVPFALDLHVCGRTLLGRLPRWHHMA